jgi:hypothetical protein
MIHIEIMLQESGCEMGCPHCPIRNKNAGSYGDQILPAFLRLQELYEGTQMEVLFMSMNMDVIPLIDRFQVNSNSHIGISLGNHSQIISNLRKLEERGHREILVGFPSKSIDISPHITNLEEVLMYWKDSQLDYLGLVGSNNTFANERIVRELAIMMSIDRDLYTRVRKKTSDPNIHVKNLYNLSEEPFSNCYRSNCVATQHDKTFQLSHRVIGHEFPASFTLEDYRKFTEADINPHNGAFTSDRLQMSLTAMGVRLCHRTVDIHNPYLWVSYPALFEAINRSQGSSYIFWERINEIIQCNIYSEIDLTGYQKISEQVIAEIEQKRNA